MHNVNNLTVHSEEIRRSEGLLNSELAAIAKALRPDPTNPPHGTTQAPRVVE